MSKQDRQGVRTTQGLEQKYSFGKVFTQQERENARQNSEMIQQNLTMKQFISFATTAIDTLQKGLALAEKTIIVLQNAVSVLEGKMHSAEDNISKHGKRLTTAEGNISNITVRTNKAEDNITSHEKRITTAEQNISKHDTTWHIWQRKLHLP